MCSLVLKYKSFKVVNVIIKVNLPQNTKTSTTQQLVILFSYAKLKQFITGKKAAEKGYTFGVEYHSENEDSRVC